MTNLRLFGTVRLFDTVRAFDTVRLLGTGGITIGSFTIRTRGIASKQPKQRPRKVRELLKDQNDERRRRESAGQRR